MNNNNFLTNSDSLLWGLCREVEYIRRRIDNIKKSLTCCQSNSLRSRLLIELSSHNRRKENILSLSRQLESEKKCDDYLISFLIEISGRETLIYN